MNNSLIALRGKSNVGKTTTIKKVYELLIKKYTKINIIVEPLKTIDIRIIIEINGIKIGIESQGDQGHEGSRLETSLKLFTENNCQIILCATRTKGATVRLVNKLNSSYLIDFIKKPIMLEKNKHNESNQKVASEIFDKIEALLSSV